MRQLKSAPRALAIASLALAVSLLGGAIASAQLHISPGDRAVVYGVGEDGLSVRLGPGYSHETITVLPEGTEVDVLQGPRWNGYVPWFEVGNWKPGSPTGWSSGLWLQPKPKPTPTPPPQPQAQPARATAVTSRGGVRDTKTSFLAIVTAYALNGETRSGTETRWGVVAVDPSVIPLGSRLTIEGFGEIFVAEDTGSAVKGNWVDIWVHNYDAAHEFGMQIRRVTILD